MKKALILHILLSALRSSEGLELQYEDISYATIGQNTFLKCAVTPKHTIKELWWFRFNDPQETVYYYDPLSTDTAVMERAKRSRVDNTSLIIAPTYLNDEGEYICRVVVWNKWGNSSTSSVPISKERKMILKVYVPPEKVEISHLTSGKNLSLRCIAVGAKPEASISWTKTDSSGVETEISDMSKKTEIDQIGKLYDTSQRLFYTLEDGEPIARISCVVKHPETDTLLYKNITFVSPAIQNAVEVAMEKLEGKVIYSSVANQDNDDGTAGLVKVTATPGFKVLYNTSVTLTVSAPGVFPEPSYLWWTGEQTGISGAELVIDNLVEDTRYYVLAKNSLGRIVLSADVAVTDEVYDQQDSMNGTRGDPITTNSAGLDGGIIAAIVVSSLLAVFLIAFLVWYCLVRNPAKDFHFKAKTETYAQEEETIPFRPEGKALMRTTSTQTLEGRRSRREPSLQGSNSAEDILNKAPAPDNTPPPGYASKDRRQRSRSAEYDDSSQNEDDTSSDGNLRSAHETGSERSLESSNGGQVINGHVDIV